MQISPFVSLYELEGLDLLQEGDFVADPNKLLAGRGFELAINSANNLVGLPVHRLSQAYKYYRRMEDPGTGQGYVAISPHTTIQQLDVIKTPGTDPKFIPAYTHFVGKTIASMYTSTTTTLIWRPDPAFFPTPAAKLQPTTASISAPVSKLSPPTVETWTCSSPRCRNRQNDVGHACYWCGSHQR